MTNGSNGVTAAAATPPADPARSRLIDYFKRLFAIVAGLAITEAVKRLFPLDQANVFGPTFWMFCTFLITIIPIFHGGDRSLDVKYLDTSPTGWGKAFYAWDVYMLVVTAILFVCISGSLPHLDQAGLVDAAAASSFYYLMAFTLAFDVAVLIVDWLKTHEDKRGRLTPYVIWILANSSLAALCWHVSIALYGLGQVGESAVLPTLIGGVAFQHLSIGIFVCALLRTILDYWAGQDFLFP